MTPQDFQGGWKGAGVRKPLGPQTCPDRTKPLATYHHLTGHSWEAAAPVLFVLTDLTRVHKDDDGFNFKGFSAQHWIE